MSDRTEISWTEATWSPVSGCTRVSPGCDHCYIERTPPLRMAGRRFDHPGIGGTTGVMLHEGRLMQPFGWKRPRRVFVCSLADLFHADVPDLHIAKVWATMARSPRHTYQVLTKRPARMRSLLRSHDFELLVEAVCGHHDFEWPLPNVWGGTTAENQEEADRRIPVLLDTPLAVRWLSAEPMLGPIDLHGPVDPRFGGRPRLNYWIGASRPSLGTIDFTSGATTPPVEHHTLDWVVVGGESGPGARPMHPDWARLLRDQCTNAGVAFHFKQWGALVTEDQAPEDITLPGISYRLLDEDGPSFYRVRPKAAGRLLDGVQHDGYPTTREETSR